MSHYGHVFIHFMYLLWYLREEWVYFIHIWSSNQVPCVADACKISFGPMPNLSNYVNIFLKFYICCNISEKNGLILFIFDTVISHNRELMHVKYTLALCQNVAFMSIISYILYAYRLIWILFIFGTVIIHHRDFMHIKYTLVLCKNWVLTSYVYFVITVVYFLCYHTHE